MKSSDFSDVISDVLKDLEGVTDDGLRALAEEYGPRLEALTVSDDPRSEYADIITNLRLAGDVLGVQAESVAWIAAGKVIHTAAGLALKVAIA